MIDAKRLAELMEPEMLAALADFIETWCGRLKQREAVSGMHDHLLRSEEDALDSVAAVLREVAKGATVEVDYNKRLAVMRETPRLPDEQFTAWWARCKVVAEKSPAVTFPSADEAERSMRESFGKAWGAGGDTDKVIEVDASGEWWGCACRDDGFCGAHHEIEQGATELMCSPHEPRPDTCPLRHGRVIVKAKA